MDASILALATAVPSYAFGQNEAAEKMISILSLDAQKGEKLKKLYQNSAIQKRHSVIGDFKKERAEWHFWGSDYPQSIPNMTQRNEAYKREAPLLAQEAAQKAIQTWGGDPQSLTHIISVSCTGVIAPGIEFKLIPTLNLKRSINRLGINFMGCFGAFKGLGVAQAFAKEKSEHRILLICTELCSLHFQTDLSGDTLVANSLFSDGAAAAIIGANPQEDEKALWDIVKHISYGLEDSLDHMTWEASERGYLMRLSPFVPRFIESSIKSFTEDLLGKDVNVNQCDWAIHPGGKAIIQGIEKALQLDETQTKSSWDTLANYGNMSSATLLFVLDHLSRQPNLRPWSASLGFGPGLSVEGLLLKHTK